MKKAITFLLTLVLVFALAAPAFAADISYAFNLPNTGQDFKTYEGGFNTKSYLNDAATIKCTTTAGGAGVKMHLVHKGFLGIGWVQATNSYWYTGTNYLLHPSYIPGKAEVNKDYYIAARIDDTLGGTHSAYGLFNSDYRNI